MDVRKSLFILFIFLHFASSQLSNEEQQALIDLANTLTPLPTGWNTTDSSNACGGSWIDITCSGGHVTKLLLNGKALQGTIPSSIQDLVYLNTLYLQDNQLTGTIPPEIGNLTALTDLTATNRLIGTIPAAIGKLTALQYLYIQDNRLNGTIPNELGNLSQLTYLIASQNQLIGTIPSSIGDLSLLKYLYVYDNNLNGTIPAEIGNLYQMIDIRLHLNSLTGSIPPSINNLDQLVYLYLDHNYLTGTIPEIGNLVKLQYLLLYQNLLNGTIPSSIGNLDQLITMHLHNNRLTGTIPDIPNLQKLQNFYVVGNSLTGTIPSSLFNLGQLQNIYAADNRLTGTIPDMTNLSALKYLNFGNNKLNGTIPSSIGNCNQLGTIYLYQNELTGEIPIEIFDIESLKILILFDNKLSGTIPSAIGNLTELEFLQIYSNKLVGTIPPEIEYLSAIVDFEVSSNQLTGTIPPGITSLTELQTVWLSDNLLSGTVPFGFSSLNSLNRLQLQNNNLEGCFDETLNAGIICDVSNNPLTCHPAQCMFTLTPGLQPSGQPESNNLTPTNPDDVLAIALGVSIPIGCALIAGIAVLIILLQRRKKKQQNQLLNRTSGNNQRLSQVLPPNMIINFKDLKFGKELGSGDFGKVFEGEWQKSKVAIKVSTSGDFESFYNEAELMLNLRPHPNVVQTLGYCQEGDKLVVVVEYCDGGSLDKKLFDQDDAISPIDQFNLIWNIAKGVFHLHTNKIIHRDLAARNILLSHGVPKISDFGLSRKVEQVQKHSQTKTTLGPIRWMAPESLRNPIYNEKTDVWAFGIVCWEIICRQEPHLDEDPLSIGGKIRDECFTPTVPEDCNPKLKQLMKDCWNSDPDNRPDIKSICDRLEKFFM